jgi:hypothetical protein
VKIYNDRKYTSTTMVRHEGMVVAFAVTTDRRIYYSVLGIDQADRARGELDAAYWNAEPGLLSFPAEIVDLAADLPVGTAMPTVRRNGRESDVPLEPGAGDAFLSTTARLSSGNPIHVVSDGRYILVFRQAVAAGADGSVYELTGGGGTGDAARTDVNGSCPGTMGHLSPGARPRLARRRTRLQPASTPRRRSRQTIRRSWREPQRRAADLHHP